MNPLNVADSAALNTQGSTLTAERLGRLAYDLLTSPDVSRSKRRVVSFKNGDCQVMLSSFYEKTPNEDSFTPYEPEPIHFVMASTRKEPQEMLRRHLHSMHDLLGAMVGFERRVFGCFLSSFPDPFHFVLSSSFLHGCRFHNLLRQAATECDRVREPHRGSLTPHDGGATNRRRQLHLRAP